MEKGVIRVIIGGTPGVTRGRDELDEEKEQFETRQMIAQEERDRENNKMDYERYGLPY